MRTRRPSLFKTFLVFAVTSIAISRGLQLGGAGQPLADNIGFPAGVLCAIAYYAKRWVELDRQRRSGEEFLDGLVDGAARYNPEDDELDEVRGAR